MLFSSALVLSCLVLSSVFPLLSLIFGLVVRLPSLSGGGAYAPPCSRVMANLVSSLIFCSGLVLSSVFLFSALLIFGLVSSVVSCLVFLSGDGGAITSPPSWPPLSYLLFWSRLAPSRLVSSRLVSYPYVGSGASLMPAGSGSYCLVLYRIPPASPAMV